MRLPSPSTALSVLALVLASGGVGYAATQVGPNQIRTGAVGTRAIHDRSVRVRDLAPSARPPAHAITKTNLRDAITEVLSDPASGINITVHGEKGDPGAQGPAGPQGSPGVTQVTYPQASASIGPLQVATLSAVCDAGQHVLGGGASSASATAIQASGPGGTDSWTARISNTDTTTPANVVVTAICAVTG
jgi:hypothetical protein